MHHKSVDKFKKLFTPTNNDLSYYPLLFMAMEETKQGDVIEMGMGNGSTPILHDYCEKAKRNLFSYEEKQEWFNKFLDKKSQNHILVYITDWDCVKNNHATSAKVIFIDHAPGERRKEDIVNFKDTKGILVIHDTEPNADYGYQMRQHFKLFKYKVEIETDGAWATALSNEIDITKWDGQKFGNYKISK